MFTQQLETPAIVKFEVVRYVHYARQVFPVVCASFRLLIVFCVCTLDIIMSSTDELDLDVLHLITAFSNLSLKDPPIYHVPNDILYMLFRLVCAGPPSLETLKQALALTHVCGSWRAIVVHIPHLWTFARMFHKSPLGRFNVGPHNRVMVVNSLLRRSPRLPFEFHLVGKDFMDMSWNAGSEVAPMFGKALRRGV